MKHLMAFLTIWAVAAGCSGDDDAEEAAPDSDLSENTEFTLEELMTFDEYPLYFAGSNWDGFPVDNIRRGEEVPPVQGGGEIRGLDLVEFSYRGCTDPSDKSECPHVCPDCDKGSPLVIQVMPVCEWHEYINTGGVRPEDLQADEVRGVPAVRSDFAFSLTLFTSDVAVAIAVFDPALARDVANALEPANDIASADEELPGAVEGAVDGSVC